MEDNMEFDDNRNKDPDFEPERKKHKKNHDIISNDLMLYVITKFGKAFYTETDKVERKLMCDMIRNDLINEKNTVIETEIIYENLMTQKRTFLREKKKSNPQKAKWPFFEAFLALGSCIRSESSTSEKKSSSSGKSHSKSRKSPTHKKSKKSSKDDSVNSVNESQTGIGLKDLFGGSYSEVDASKKNENNDKKLALNISIGPSTSKSFNALQSTPKSEKGDQTAVRAKGFLFDNSVDVQEKLGFYFGKYDSDDTSLATQVPNDNKKESEIPNDIKTEAEMVAYLDILVPEKTDTPEVEEPIMTQFDPMDYINSSQPTSEENFASQYPATQPFVYSQEIEDMPDPNDSTKTNLDINNGHNALEKMITDDEKPSINDSKEKTLNNIMNEVMSNEKIDNIGGSSEQIKELKELFNVNESQITAMLELEEKLFKMQHDIIKSELKFKAKLVEILENIHK
jgi:hypothetical protein